MVRLDELGAVNLAPDQRVQVLAEAVEAIGILLTSMDRSTVPDVLAGRIASDGMIMVTVPLDPTSPISISCGFCHAEPGDVCVIRGTDKPSSLTHNRRVRAWKGIRRILREQAAARERG
jgi:hypothetical protein